MNPNQIKNVQIFLILFFSSLTLYVLFKEAKKRDNHRFSRVQKTTKIASSSSTPLPQPSPIKEQKNKSQPLSEERQKVIDQFKRQGEEVLAKLPYREDLQQLNDGQVHKIPESLLQTGRELGQLKELVIRYPDFKELQIEAKSFYKNCADEEGYPTSIRSLCLFNRLQLAKNSGEIFDISPYPLEIKQLALELAPFRRD